MCVDARIGGMVTKEKEDLSLCLVTTEWMKKDAERKTEDIMPREGKNAESHIRYHAKAKAQVRKPPPAAIAAEASAAAVAKS